MGLYFSATAQDCHLVFPRVIVFWHLDSGGWLKTSIAHEPTMSKDGRFQICRVLHQTVKMNVNANG